MNDLLLISPLESFREAVSSHARSCPDLISNFHSAPSFFESLIKTKDTIIVVDGTSLYNGSLEPVLHFASKTPMIIVKNLFGPNEVYRLLKSGVRGLVCVEEFYTKFFEIIYTTGNNKFYLGSGQVNRLFNDMKNTLDLEVLSRRERQILPLMMKGLTYMEIANELGVSYETIKSHAKNIFRKLEVRTRRDLLKYDFNN